MLRIKHTIQPHHGNRDPKYRKKYIHRIDDHISDLQSTVENSPYGFQNTSFNLEVAT